MIHFQRGPDQFILRPGEAEGAEAPGARGGGARASDRTAGAAAATKGARGVVRN